MLPLLPPDYPRTNLSEFHSTFLLPPLSHALPSLSRPVVELGEPCLISFAGFLGNFFFFPPLFPCCFRGSGTRTLPVVRRQLFRFSFNSWAVVSPLLAGFFFPSELKFPLQCLGISPFPYPFWSFFFLNTATSLIFHIVTPSFIPYPLFFFVFTLITL